MKHLHYLEIENFKQFGNQIRIDLEHPTTLIGPNNCGKTTVLQAIALWSMAVKEWNESRGESLPTRRIAIPINRLKIVSIPVRRTRYFWHNMNVRKANKDIWIKITAGVLHDDREDPVPVSMEFRNQGEDLVYCKPGEATLEAIRANIKLLETAAGLNVHLLYPMSGLDAEEPILQPGRIDVLMGQGQTAQSLRNLCLQVYQNNPGEWDAITDWMSRLFSIDLEKPNETARGSIDLFYIQEGVKEKLDISLAGRGLHQMLLILAYLHSHPGSVLLVDEPDAHLEILRQNQVYAILKKTADETDSQVILATHSEVLFQEAVDDNLTFMMGGKANNLSSDSSAESVQNALKSGEADDYIKALQRGHVLYVEGRTDIHILRELSKKIGHKAADLWYDRINAHYTQNNHPGPEKDRDDNEPIEERYGKDPEQDFPRWRRMIPNLRGLAILDSDGHNRKTSNQGGLRIVRWRRYEIENYFVSPEPLLKYVDAKWPLARSRADEILNALILEQIFGGNEQKYAAEGPELRNSRQEWDDQTANTKLSTFAEEFFRRLHKEIKSPMLLRKGDLYRLIQYVDPASIDSEVGEKLDMVADLFENAEPNE